jgi:pantoate--beta-alanine ligase
MTDRLCIARTIPALRRIITPWRARVERIALVPTMGALHGGHIALVREARRRARRVVVSVFVNPAQFGPHEDFATYPRKLDTDLAVLATTGADLVWAPPVSVMYPAGFATRIMPAGPATAGLEDRFRPHFFSGVATVVGKLLNQCTPDFAMFGEKDYQQLKVVTRLAKDLDLPVKIIGVPTVREKDGLALSSRNAYLSESDRAAAPILHRVLEDCAGEIARGLPLAAVLDHGRTAMEAAGFRLDYLEARNSETLQPIASVEDGPVRLLVAAHIGNTRLIDNVGVATPRMRSPARRHAGAGAARKRGPST